MTVIPKIKNEFKVLVQPETSYETEAYKVASYALTDMTDVGGTIADLNTLNATYLILAETNTTDSNVVFTFTNVRDFSNLSFTGSYYPNSTSHYWRIQIWNVALGAWTDISQLGAAIPIQSIYLRITNMQDYISATKEVKIRFIHPPTGTTSHRLNIDQLLLIRHHDLMVRYT